MGFVLGGEYVSFDECSVWLDVVDCPAVAGAPVGVPGCGGDEGVGV